MILISSRGSLQTKIPEIWWKDPSWLQVKEHSPRQPDTKPSEESEKDVKILIKLRFRSIVFTTVTIQDDFYVILHMFDLHKALKISAWILRFIKKQEIRSSINCRISKSEKKIIFSMNRVK